MNQDDYDEFLASINQYLPKNIDWKQGAIDYLKSLCSEGEHQKVYHYSKPFLGGPDFTSFFQDILSFLNALKHFELPMKSKFIDVACGSGWTSLYLAKLGHEVCGIDISPDLIEIAKEKTRNEKYGVYPGESLKADFLVHDIEDAPLDVKDSDCAVLFSALHHFYDPLAAISNLARSLKDNGIIYVWEGVSPEPGTPWFKENMNIMENYHTIERPYSQSEIVKMFEMTGFKHYEFYSEINGLYNIDHLSDTIRLSCDATEWRNKTCFIASRQPDFFVKKGRHGTSNLEAINKLDLMSSLIRDPSNKSFFDHVHTIYKIYERYFDCAPNSDEILHWVEKLKLGETLQEKDFLIKADEVYPRDNKRLHFEGWAEIDGGGSRWSLEYSSRLYFYVDKQGKDSIKEIVLVVGTNGTQTLGLILNGKKVYFEVLCKTQQELVISGQEILEGINQLEFNHPDANSPNSQDPRLLAIHLIDIKFSSI